MVLVNEGGREENKEADVMLETETRVIQCEQDLSGLLLALKMVSSLGLQKGHSPPPTSVLCMYVCMYLLIVDLIYSFQDAKHKGSKAHRPWRALLMRMHCYQSEPILDIVHERMFI